MTIDQMKARKIELGYTNEILAEMAGVPLGTVQKIFAGTTKAPRYDTIQKLEKVLEAEVPYSMDSETGFAVAEPAPAYNARSSAGSRRKTSKDVLAVKPIKVKLGLFNGKFEMPPDEMFFDDEIAEMFEDI